MQVKMKLTRFLLLGVFFTSRLLFRIALASEDIELDESYSIIEDRAIENLDSLMVQPKFALDSFNQFYHSIGFPHDLQAPDREFALKYMYSLMASEVGLTISYALESGMCLGYFIGTAHRVTFLAYREPGVLYPIDYDNSQKDLYFNTCINDASEPQQCTMKTGERYISCIDECSLIRCNDTESQATNCSSYALDSTDYTECESKIKWCENYEIKYALGNGTEGYIPLTFHCYDPQGVITETPGNVLIGKRNGDIILGNCVQGQAGPLISRNISGSYAQCGLTEDSVCSTTFTGGYHSSNYGKDYTSMISLFTSL